jgi:hypothetical protein
MNFYLSLKEACFHIQYEQVGWFSATFCYLTPVLNPITFMVPSSTSTAETELRWRMWCTGEEYIIVALFCFSLVSLHYFFFIMFFLFPFPLLSFWLKDGARCPIKRPNTSQIGYSNTFYPITDPTPMEDYLKIQASPLQRLPSWPRNPP